MVCLAQVAVAVLVGKVSHAGGGRRDVVCFAQAIITIQPTDQSRSGCIAEHATRCGMLMQASPG